MAALKALMRVFSYLFHGLLTLFLLAISVVAFSSGQPLQLGMLPWQGTALAYWIFFCSLIGLIAVVLAVRNQWLPLFFFWNLVVLAMLIRGFVFSHYHFDGPAAFHRALYLMAGAIIAALGAWFQLRNEPQLRRRGAV